MFKNINLLGLIGTVTGVVSLVIHLLNFLNSKPKILLECSEKSNMVLYAKTKDCEVPIDVTNHEEALEIAKNELIKHMELKLCVNINLLISNEGGKKTTINSAYISTSEHELIAKLDEFEPISLEAGISLRKEFSFVVDEFKAIESLLKRHCILKIKDNRNKVKLLDVGILPLVNNNLIKKRSEL